MWARYHEVHKGITRSEVHRVLPSPNESGADREFWLFGGVERDGISLTVSYSPDDKVREIERRHW